MFTRERLAHTFNAFVAILQVSCQIRIAWFDVAKLINDPDIANGATGTFAVHDGQNVLETAEKQWIVSLSRQ